MYILKYKAQDYVVKSPGKFSLTFTPTDGSPKHEIEVFNFKGPGVALGITESSNCFRFTKIKFIQ